MQLHEPQTVSMAEKNCFSHYVCHCGAVVKELFARADKPDSTPCDAVFCLLVVLFCFVHRLNHQYYNPKISSGFAPQK